MEEDSHSNDGIILLFHDGTTIRLFLDGKIIGQATTSTVPDNVSQPLNIGRELGTLLMK